MTAYNIVRMRVRAGQQRSFETMNAVERTSVPKGARRADLVKTGDTSYCFIGEWSSYMDIVERRARDPFTEEDLRAQDAMRKRWLMDQVFSDPYSSIEIPFEVHTLWNAAPRVRF